MLQFNDIRMSGKMFLQVLGCTLIKFFMILSFSYSEWTSSSQSNMQALIILSDFWYWINRNNMCFHSQNCLISKMRKTWMVLLCRKMPKYVGNSPLISIGFPLDFLTGKPRYTGSVCNPQSFNKYLPVPPDDYRDSPWWFNFFLRV